jgi:hypothetical protein
MKIDLRMAAGRLAPACAVFVLVACGPSGDQAPRSEILVSDSAGVTIVENPADAEATALEWTLDSEPVLRIGTVEGEEAYEFSRIAGGNSQGVARLADGTIVVLDAASRELRYFGSDGSHLASAGGAGEGPGEFSFPHRLFLLPGDTIAVWDLNLRRFELFDGAGGHAATITPPEEGRISDPFGFLGPRTVVTRAGSGGLARPGDPEEMRTVRSHFLRIDMAQPGSPDTLAVAGRQLWLRWANGGGGMGGFTPVPFSIGAEGAAEPGRLVITPGHEPELRMFGAEGQLVRIVRIAGGPQPLSEAEFAREVERRIEEQASSEDARRELRRRHSLMPVPAAAPAWTHILLDPEGDVWVEHFRPDWENRMFGDRLVGPARWTVFDAEGVIQATVEVPAGFTPHQVTSEGLLGVHRDELGVEYVQLLRLERR